MKPMAQLSLPFAQWLPTQRWYAGRSRTLVAADPAEVIALRDDLDLVLVDATYAQGPPERYQVVLKWCADPAAIPGGVTPIGVDGGYTAFDALYDPEAAAHLLSLCAHAADLGAVTFTKEPDVTLPLDAPARVSGAEQSNTSVVFGKDAILKVFRRISPGINPDIELNRVLGRAGNKNVARLLASFDTTWDGAPCPLGMVTSFAAGSTEGWAMATARVADGYADFHAESGLLGGAVAAVHAALASTLGTASAHFDVATATARLHTAASSVAALQPMAPAVEKRFAFLSGQPLEVQRVHGDLHLGQVLRTPGSWLLIDFEGEPGAPLEERRAIDSPLRDVAGMLRSYEYAAHQAAGDHRDESAARAWADANRDAFCSGYAAVAGFDPRSAAPVLAAYELDKAVYEAAYEARYRPDWLPIPMRSIERLLS